MFLTVGFLTILILTLEFIFICQDWPILTDSIAFHGDSIITEEWEGFKKGIGNKRMKVDKK